MGFVFFLRMFQDKCQCHCNHLKALGFLYAFEESVDCHLLSSFCHDSNLHISLFKYVLSTMGVNKESISKFLIGNRFHVKLRILSPYLNNFLNKDLFEFENRVNSSGSKKTADSHVALRGNFSAPVRSSDSANVSKNAASLVD